MKKSMKNEKGKLNTKICFDHRTTTPPHANLLTNSMHSMRIKPRIGSAMFVKVVKNIIPPVTGITWKLSYNNI